MDRPLFSPYWSRVKDLRPRLRAHAEIHRQVFRGAVWHVIEDRANGAFQRVSEAGFRLVGLMNGRRTVEEIWRAAGERLGDDLPSQDETIQLLVRLHRADLLHADIPPDMAQVVTEGARTRRRKALQSVRNPLAIRIPLFDPDRFLRATQWMVRPLFGWFGILLWLVVVAAGLVLVGLHWTELTRGVADTALSVQNVLLMLMVYPCVKALHELGHAYAVRRRGGEVHEIGIMLLVFLPVPYVDASASTAFRSKWSRAGVAAAGILVELFLAALAMIVWTMLEPGLARAVAFNVMLICGISTLLFNGNPLLRFDGYYVLADLIEIPNLGPRSNQHLLHLIQRWLFGMTDSQSPATSPGESAWFVVYGITATVYRLFIMAVIALFVAGQFFEIGLALAFWTVVLLLVVPTGKAVRFILADPRLEGRRGRALAVTGAGLGALGWALFWQPLPYATVVQGVVVAPERAVANAGADGFIVELLVDPGQIVMPGSPILRLEEPLLDARVTLIESRLHELELRRFASLSADRTALDVITHELALLREELALVKELRGEQMLISGNAGVLLLPVAEDLVGRHVRKGETLAYIVGPQDPLIRVAVLESDVDLVRRRMQEIHIRFASSPETAFPGRVLRATPAATRLLPSEALGSMAGGRIAIDPSATSGQIESLDNLFLFDIVPAEGAPRGAIGERAHIRFGHGTEPLGLQLWRSVRQVFLRVLNV